MDAFDGNAAQSEVLSQLLIGDGDVGNGSAEPTGQYLHE
jgi:hypothetical protein